MTMPKSIISALVLTSIVFASCYPEIGNGPTDTFSEQSNAAYPNVDSRLWSYFENFELEARLRGIQIDLVHAEITGEVERIVEDGVAGTCQFGRHIHHVTIDEDYWNQASQLWREMVVFHELGHCALDRGHLETENSNGACLSIMNSGTSGCNLRYNNTNREYYLDELFGVGE